MKILEVMNYRLHRGGLTGAVEELVSSLRSEGLQVDIISTHGKIFERISNIIKIIKTAKNYDFIMAAGCADYGFLPIVVGVIAARLNKKRILVDFHAGYSLPFMLRFGKLAKMFVGDIPVTVASGYLYGLFKNCKFNVFLIPYHFHYENFPRITGKFAWNKKIMWTGSFQFMYDPETALKAAQLVLAKNQDVEFHFFGTGPLLQKLQKKYKHKNIVFKGFVPRSELLSLYRQYSIFLNPSFGDNFPLKLVEAAYSELLVIAARYGGTASVYNDDECLFFEKGDFIKLSELISNVLTNPDNYNYMRNNMHNKVMSFTWDRVKDKWFELIKPNEIKC